MDQYVDTFALLSARNICISVTFSFALLMIIIWRLSKAYSCSDNMDLCFRSRAVGVQHGEPAHKALLDSNHSCSLSVIIPAFKEATRIPQSLEGTLLAAADHLQEHQRINQGFSWEIIVVDDGSPDGTADSVIRWTNHLPCAARIRVLSLPQNMGKGAAVKTGMYVDANAVESFPASIIHVHTKQSYLDYCRLRARGQFLLMADADGAAPISEWVKLCALADRNEVVIGRRKSTQRKFSRLILSLGFRMLIRLVS
jgi:hypothetical protein